MNAHASFARRGAARLLIGPLAALCLAVPVLAGPGETPDEKSEAAKAAKVAKKVEKALEKARKEEEEPVEADRRALRKFHEEVMEYAELHAKQVANIFKIWACCIDENRRVEAFSRAQPDAAYPTVCQIHARHPCRFKPHPAPACRFEKVHAELLRA